ncbi:MAG: H-NS histone family protein [Hylemonella sp.]|nr:H-NS histone family protein [Hylemonella sp.]
MSHTSVAVQLEKLRKKRKALEKKEKALLNRASDRALAKIVHIAREAGVSATAIVTALNSAGGPQSSAQLAISNTATASRKIAPKYRNPEDATQTWTGRGRPPLWALALREAGRLDEALIGTSH